ncbi:hypothetical protein SNEBB_010135 [Seison nebaliae]|nr:hypothetical protein SNEBB_010135 [Seison nebaliae]
MDYYRYFKNEIHFFYENSMYDEMWHMLMEVNGFKIGFDEFEKNKYLNDDVLEKCFIKENVRSNMMNHLENVFAEEVIGWFRTLPDLNILNNLNDHILIKFNKFYSKSTFIHIRRLSVIVLLIYLKNALDFVESNSLSKTQLMDGTIINEVIFERLFDTDEFIRSKILNYIFSFVEFHKEIMTDPILKRLLMIFPIHQTFIEEIIITFLQKRNDFLFFRNTLSHFQYQLVNSHTIRSYELYNRLLMFLPNIPLTFDGTFITQTITSNVQYKNIGTTILLQELRRSLNEEKSLFNSLREIDNENLIKTYSTFPKILSLLGFNSFQQHLLNMRIKEDWLLNLIKIFRHIPTNFDDTEDYYRNINGINILFYVNNILSLIPQFICDIDIYLNCLNRTNNITNRSILVKLLNFIILTILNGHFSLMTKTSDMKTILLLKMTNWPLVTTTGAKWKISSINKKRNNVISRIIHYFYNREIDMDVHIYLLPAILSISNDFLPLQNFLQKIEQFFFHTRNISILIFISYYFDKHRVKRLRNLIDRTELSMIDELKGIISIIDQIQMNDIHHIMKINVEEKLNLFKKYYVLKTYDNFTTLKEIDKCLIKVLKVVVDRLLENIDYYEIILILFNNFYEIIRQYFLNYYSFTPSKRYDELHELLEEFVHCSSKLLSSSSYGFGNSVGEYCSYKFLLTSLTYVKVIELLVNLTSYSNSHVIDERSLIVNDVIDMERMTFELRKFLEENIFCENRKLSRNIYHIFPFNYLRKRIMPNEIRRNYDKSLKFSNNYYILLFIKLIEWKCISLLNFDHILLNTFHLTLFHEDVFQLMKKMFNTNQFKFGICISRTIQLFHYKTLCHTHQVNVENVSELKFVKLSEVEYTEIVEKTIKFGKELIKILHNFFIISSYTFYSFNWNLLNFIFDLFDISKTIFPRSSLLVLLEKEGIKDYYLKMFQEIISIYDKQFDLYQLKDKHIKLFLSSYNDSMTNDTTTFSFKDGYPRDEFYEQYENILLLIKNRKGQLSLMGTSTFEEFTSTLDTPETKGERFPTNIPNPLFKLDVEMTDNIQSEKSVSHSSNLDDDMGDGTSNEFHNDNQIYENSKSSESVSSPETRSLTEDIYQELLQFQKYSFTQLLFEEL